MKSIQTIFLKLILLTALVSQVAWGEEKPGVDTLRQAKVFASAGRYKDAIALLKSFDAQDRADELTINLLVGKIYSSIDRPASAREFFELAYDQDIENFDAAIGLATSHMQLGNFKQARHFLNLANDLEKNSPEPTLLQSMIHYRTGSIREANQLMQDLVRQRPDSAEVAVSYAKYLHLAGDNVNAVKSLQSFTEKNPLAADVKDYLGELEFLFGSKSNGIKLKQTAAQLYDQQGHLFKRDVVSAWLQVNMTVKDQPPVSNPSPSIPEVKKEPPAAPVVGKTQAKPPEKLIAPVKPVLPAPSDKELSLPVQRFPFPDGVMITGGSGFIVDGGRKVVTNRHVVEDGKEFAVRTGLGEIIKAKLVFTSKTDDIAVLELAKALPGDRAIPNVAYSKPRVGRNVVVMGYPLWSILGQGSPSLTNGVVSKRTGMADDVATFQLTAKVNKGNSGGPVFDMAGNVVGITVGKLDSKKIQDEQGFLPEDVNFAIHVDRLPKMINAQLEASQPNAVELSAEDLYQAMIGKVVMVATYK